MDDELEKFIKQHKSRVAEDKTSLEQGPPAYLEIRKNDQIVYNATLKENIPPIKSSPAQEKEESCCLSLPLGEDYERKKQKLQQELRLDYRRYMAQLDSLRDPPDPTDVHYSPRPPMALPPQRAPTRRDVATLTEGREGLHRAGRSLVDSRTIEDTGPDEDVLLPKERARMVRVEFDSDEDLAEEELGLMERRRLRQTQTGLERGEERRWHRRHYTTDFREMSRLRNKRTDLPDDYKETRGCSDRKSSASFVPDVDYLQARLCTSSLTPKPKLQGPARMRPNKDEPEFATGLIIGASDAEAALQRRKERYRQELEEQIAEQQRNRKREKDLELRVALTGATDPEKERDRLKPLGAVNSGDHARRRRDGLYRTGQAVDLVGDVLHRRPHDDNRERLPPEQPRVAFQSPLLEYSHSLGLDIGGTASYIQANPRNAPRNSSILPHPSSTLSDVYRTPNEEAYIYYGARSPMEPNVAYYGQIPLAAGVQQPMSYQSLPPPGSHPSQRGHHSQQSGTSHPEAFPHRRASAAVTTSSGIGVFPAEQVKPSKESVMSYKEALRQQIRDQQERRRLDREERDRYEARLEADLKNHDPWGRGGEGHHCGIAGATSSMHKHNKEAYINPETWQKRATSTMEETSPPSTHRLSGFVHAPSFARGSVFGNVPTPQQVNEQDQYKAYLKQQIEEKRRKEAEEKERQRLEEERWEKRLAEQRESIQREYEEEQERKKRKEMEQKAKNEELIRLAEEQRKEVETKKKQAEDKENAALRMQYEEERQTRLQQVPREASPPIPTLQKRHAAPQYTPRPPSMDSRRSTAVPLSERSLSGLQSPPVPAGGTS
ncbi:hypothetical protein UPYG_G00289580 [Umbra pygmaea]|uniref:Centrosome and spindle pole associated protein 1 n=1 Tax=Umbra pygmaea TaxID=75934 RepID=A0ABD0W523_UMBPY